MYSSRRKSKQSYRKRVASRKNKTRSKRKNLKFRRFRGGGPLSFEQFIKRREDLGQAIQYGSMDGYNTDKEEAELRKLHDEHPEHVAKMKENDKLKRDEEEKQKREAYDKQVEINKQQEAERAKARQAQGVKYLYNPNMDPANWGP